MVHQTVIWSAVRRPEIKLGLKDIEILSASSLLSTDIFVCTQFGDTHKWQKENRDPRKLTPVRFF